MVSNLCAQIAYLITAFTLQPGHLIATGMPAGTSVSMEPQTFLKPGDVVRCEIDKIGAIENAIENKVAGRKKRWRCWGALSVTLEVSDLASDECFYTDAGLVAGVERDVARLRCEGQDRDTVVLLGGYPRKRLHQLALRGDDLDGIAGGSTPSGGKVVSASDGFEENGV